MLARLQGMLHPRRSLVLLAVLLAGVTTASASWHLPGAGAGSAPRRAPTSTRRS